MSYFLKGVGSVRIVGWGLGLKFSWVIFVFEVYFQGGERDLLQNFCFVDWFFVGGKVIIFVVGSFQENSVVFLVVTRF